MTAPDPLARQVGGHLGNRSATGVLTLPNPLGASLWTVRFLPADLYAIPFEVYHAVIEGPGGNFRVYRDNELYSLASRGDINEYDPNTAMYVRPGQSLFFYWSIGTGTAPKVNMSCREPRQ